MSTTIDNLKKQTSSSLTNDSPTSSPSTPNHNILSALHILQSPDGYYTYLGITKPPPTTHKSLLSQPKKEENDDKQQVTEGGIDKVKIEKNYRKLSLKLHPDRPGGDAETFRMLERAKSVLMSDKLRREYDLLGLDLEEEEEHHHDHNDDDHKHHHESSGDYDKDGHSHGDKKSDGNNSSNPDSVISHMASATVTGILQLAVRTAMMAFVSLFLSKFKYTTIPTMLFLLYTSFQISRARKDQTHLITNFDIASPLLIGFGVLLLYYGRVVPLTLSEEDVGDANERQLQQSFWSWTFWLGETIVMTMFALNTVTGRENSPLKPSLPLGIAFFILSLIACLILRGKTWRYITLLGFEICLALLAVLIFPIMEMILEEIMNDKLKKIGNKVRQYSKAMEESYMVKLEEKERSFNNNNSGDKSSSGGNASKVAELD